MSPHAGARPPGSLARATNPRGTILRLATYFRAFRVGLAAVAACILAYTVAGLAGPYLMGIALDRFIEGRDAVGLARLATVMLVAFGVGNALQVVASWLMAGLSQRALKRLRGDLFRHLQTLPIAFFERHASGELLSRLTNDMDAINQAVGQNVTALLASTLAMSGILIAMFALNHWLALASLLVVPLMLWFARFVAVYTRRGFKELQQQVGVLHALLEESIGGQRVIRAFRREESVLGSFQERNESVYRVGVSANTYALLLMPLTSVLGTLFVIVLAGLGGWLALEGLVSVGVIATFISYGQNFVQPLRQISNLYNTLQAAVAGAERIFEVLDTPGEVDTATAPVSRLAAKSPSGGLRGDVSFEHVTFGYLPGRATLDDVSFEVRQGQRVALVGPTGAGKTTVIQVLTRFYEIESGTIRIDGTDIRELTKADLRSQIGVVLQDTFLFGATVMDNLRYGMLDASDDEVFRAAEVADADHFIRQLPQGYRTMLSERGGNLSRGQRQLLAIARTLLANPPLLVLDEATSNVDTRTEARIQTALSRLMKGRTSFVVAHRMSTIRDADLVLVMDHGQIVERGTHVELLAARGLYARLAGSSVEAHDG